jgi:multidrug efflux pump
MTGLVDWASERARMILALIVVSLTAGIFSYTGLPKEGEPDIEIPALFISVPFPGISAGDSETLLVRPMETELGDIDGLKKMTGNRHLKTMQVWRWNSNLGGTKPKQWQTCATP